MNISENRQAGRRANAIERSETFVEPGPAVSAGVRAIRFVEARLVDDAARHAFGESREMLADAQVERVALEHARTGNEKQRITSESAMPRQSAASTSDCRAFSVAWRRFWLRRGRDEAGEQRMRARRTRLQLRVELAADEPWMIS